MNTKQTNIQQIKQLTNTTLFNKQEVPKNMNTQFCIDTIKELELVCENPNSPNVDEDLVFITQNGHVYRKKKIIDGIERRYVWTILHNNNGACGWYRVDSPALNSFNTSHFLDSAVIQMTDGTYADSYPQGAKVYNIKSLSYSLVSPMTPSEETHHCVEFIENEGKEELYLFISLPQYGGNLLLGYMYPLLKATSAPFWTFSPNIEDKNVLNAWNSSKNLSSLPFYEPDIGEKLPVFFNTTENTENTEKQDALNVHFEEQKNVWDVGPLTPWGQEEVSSNQEDWVQAEVPKNSNQEDWGTSENQEEEEYRFDMLDRNWYTKSEFLEYYGDEILWKIGSPENATKIWLIENMIERGHHILSSKEINHLLDKAIGYF